MLMPMNCIKNYFATSLMNKKVISQNKLPILLLAILGIFTCLFFILGYFTFLDSEWQDWQLLGRVRENHQTLRSYKLSHNSYPASLAEAGLKNHHCIFLKCFDIQYKVSSNKQSYTTVIKANSPFVIFFDSKCPAIPILDEDHKSICAQIGFEENYKGERTDFPIYLKDTKWFPNPLDWPQL